MGGVDGDRVRPIPGSVGTTWGGVATGAFAGPVVGYDNNTGTGNGTLRDVSMHIDNVVPTGPANAPRRWGALACAYLGQPAS